MQAMVQARSPRSAVLAIALIAFSGSAIAEDFTLRTVTLKGKRAPGVGTEVFSRFFLTPRIDRNGRVAFYADVEGRQICVDGTGIWSERTGTLQLVALEGQPAPGTPGVFRDLCGLNSFNPNNLGMDADGFVTFATLLDSPDLQDCNLNGFFENETAYYTNRGGTLRLALRENDHAPGFPPDYTFDNLSAVYVSPAGDFGSGFVLKSGGCPDFGDAPNSIYWDQGAGLQRVAQPGEPAPIPGMTFNGYGICPKVTMDVLGILGYNNLIAGPGVNASNDLVFVLDDHGTRRIKVREGQIAPGVEPGLRINIGFGCAGFEAGLASVRADVHAFSTELLDANTFEQRNFAALYVSRADDKLVFITRVGDRAPGTSGGAFADLGLRFPAFRPLPVADRGQVVFHAHLKHEGGIGFANDETVYSFDGEGAIRLLAREASPIPERPGISFAADVFPDATFGPAAMTRKGHFAFVARLNGPGLNPNEANALFFYEATSGTLHTFLATGDTIDVDPGPPKDLRTVRKIDSFNNDFQPNANFNGPAINEDNAMAMSILFQDGTAGVFTLRYTRDGDGDGIRDTDDNCPLLTNATQQDADADGRGDVCDCAPGNAGALEIPREVEDVRVYQDRRTIAWRASRLSAGSATTYQLFRELAGHVPAGSGPGAICLATGLTEEQTTDDAVPAPGQAFRYLVRARNACGGGWGADSSGVARSINACP